MIARLIDFAQGIIKASSHHRWDKPNHAGWCSHAPDLASSCLSCRAEARR